MGITLLHVDEERLMFYFDADFSSRGFTAVMSWDQFDRFVVEAREARHKNAEAIRDAAWTRALCESA